MKIWATGEAGFIVRNLADWSDTRSHHQILNRLEEPEYNYWRIPILNAQKEINVFDPTLPKLVEMSGAEAIVHAASVDHDVCIANPRLAVQTNIEGTCIAASIAKKLDIPFIYLSTLGRRDVFTETKLAGERLAQMISNKTIIVRPAIVYGKYDTHSDISKILNSERSKSDSMSLNIEARRNYLHVNDLMRALDTIFDNVDKITNRTIEIGNDYVTFEEIFSFIIDELNICSDCTIIQQEDYMDEVYADTFMIKSLGWSALYSYKDGIRKMIEEHGE